MTGMADRILVFYAGELTEPGAKYGPGYYLEADYEPMKLRIYASTAPNGGDCEVDILDDGVSILNQNAFLPKGDNLEDMAEDFKTSAVRMAQGSIISCDMRASGGASGIVVQLEIDKVSEHEDE